MPVASHAFREFFNCVQEDDETSSDHTRRFKTASEIIQSHLGSPVLIAKTTEGTHTVCAQIEDNKEGGMELLFSLDQATMIDEQLRPCTHIENVDQYKFISALKMLQSQKSLENDRFPRTVQKAHSLLSEIDDHKKKKNAVNRRKKAETSMSPRSKTSKPTN